MNSLLPKSALLIILFIMKMMTGEVYGLYTVGDFSGRNKHGDSLWKCVCKCGSETIINRCNLVSGNSKSCGCLKLGKDKKASPPHMAPDGAAWIQLTRGKWCLVDSEDFPLVSQYEWNLSVHGYAIRNPSKFCKSRFLHRLVMGEPNGKQVDHRNMDTLDNRKKNLRVASDTQNKFNKGLRKDNVSGYKGVNLHSQTGKWTMEIQANGIRERKSGFLTAKDAHVAYCEASKRLHGEFARTT